MRFLAIWLAVSAAIGPVAARAEWTSFGPSDGFTSELQDPVLQDRAGNLWFLGGYDLYSDGVVRYDGATTLRLLAGNRVHAVIEDRAGNLWFCTEGGISRFNGTEWTTFTIRDGLPSDFVTEALEDSRGDLWFATSSGPARSSDGRFDTFGTEPIVGARSLDILFEDGQGRVWFGDGDGLVAYDGANWSSVPAPSSGIQRSAIGHYAAADSSGGIWVITGVGVSRFDGSSWRDFSSGETYIVEDILADRSGNVWFATGGGISRFDGVNWHRYGPFNGQNLGDGQALALDRSGNVWAGFDVSTARWDGVAWRAYGPADGTPSMGPDRIFEGRDGSLWFGGLHRYDRTNWRTYTSQHGLPSDDIERGIIEDVEGRLWVASRENGIARYDGQTWTRYGAGTGLPGDIVQTMIADRRGGVWVATSAEFGTAAGGVSWFDPVSRAWTHHLMDGPYVVLKSSLQDRSGALWFGSDTGLYRFDGTSWRLFGAADGLPGDQILGHVEDRSGGIWVGVAPSAGPPASPGGVSRWDGAEWSHVTDVPMTPRLESRDGRIWFSTSTGIASFDGATWDSISLANDSLSASVWSMVEDTHGNLWVGLLFCPVPYNGESCQSEIRRFDGSASMSYPMSVVLGENSGARKLLVDRTGALWAFGGGAARFDGEAWWPLLLPSGQGLRSVYSVLESRGGAIWMGGDNFGVIEYEPDRVAPRAVIKPHPPSISANSSPFLAFRAAYRETRGVEFSYRLDGAFWSPWSPTDFFPAAGLADGIHRFEVQARDGFGNLAATPTAANFEIDATPPAPVIAAPTFGQPVRDMVSVRGIAADARFKYYWVEVRPAGATSWSSPPLAQSSSPVIDGNIASWNTSPLPDGDYQLRLSVTDSLGLTGTAQVTVVVDNHFPHADQTSPARVIATTGGDLYTTNQELHLYFPPHAFDQDALVSIAAGAASPDTLPSGAIRVLPAYEISWSAASLRKHVTLEFSTAGSLSGQGALAVYSSPNGNAWQRLGGTPEEGKLSLAIREPGRYALFAETAPFGGTASLSTLSFTPRVFSVGSQFANDHVAIGFALGRPAPVTVRIYNRAGRLVNEVVSGQTMGAGANLVRWDGRDRAGVYVADGIYLVTVEAVGQTRKNTLAVVR